MLENAEPLRFTPRRDDTMVMPAPLYWTAQMVRDLPEDRNKYECIDGELLVTPAPGDPHERVFIRLTLAAGNYIEREQCGALYGSKSDISWGRFDVMVQPDLFVVDLEQARTGKWVAMRDLLLAVEIISPSSGSRDRGKKRQLYQQQGVRAYWIVDPKAAAVEVWTPADVEPRVVHDRLSWHPQGAYAPLVVSLPALFAPL